jgi:uncharacterized membrane protein YdbT with pleckstrin-like domain
MHEYHTPKKKQHTNHKKKKENKREEEKKKKRRKKEENEPQWSLEGCSQHKAFVLALFAGECIVVTLAEGYQVQSQPAVQPKLTC